MITKESFEETVDLLIQASPKSNVKGKHVMAWVSENFGVKARVSLATGAAIANRVNEQFAYKCPVVIFVCKDDVNVDSLISCINENIYSELDVLLLMSSSKPYRYYHLFTRTPNHLSTWMERNLGTIMEYISSSNEIEIIPVSKSTENNSNFIITKKGCVSYPHQQIFYGAPGTGKSYKTNEVAKKYSTIRTTFHPDSDYSTFVGVYKPTTVSEERYGLNGSNTVALTYPNGERSGKPIKDRKIEYRFVKQAFMKAYVKAWRQFADAESMAEAAPQFLVIEEINRGNCAQIFGDLFQLLDRKEGFSEYPVEADNDIHNSLLKEDTRKDPSFGEDGLQFTEEQIESINQIFNDDDSPFHDVANEIAQGQVLVLPPNFYIWATMNTSDQSLFPIDSAFKRRWEWKYVRISEGKKKDGTPLNYRIKFTIPANGEAPAIPVDVPWWDFVKAINKQIEDATKSEDKKLGYFFCKPDKKANNADDCCTVISAETFVGKVVFYLWQDVFKDYGFKSDIFKRADKSKISFHDFYPDNIATDEQANPEAIDLQLVKEFIDKVIEKDKSKEQTPVE